LPASITLRKIPAIQLNQVIVPYVHVLTVHDPARREQTARAAGDSEVEVPLAVQFGGNTPSPLCTHSPLLAPSIGVFRTRAMPRLFGWGWSGGHPLWPEQAARRRYRPPALVRALVFIGIPGRCGEQVFAGGQFRLISRSSWFCVSSRTVEPPGRRPCYGSVHCPTARASTPSHRSRPPCVRLRRRCQSACVGTDPCRSMVVRPRHAFAIKGHLTYRSKRLLIPAELGPRRRLTIVSGLAYCCIGCILIRGELP